MEDLIVKKWIEDNGYGSCLGSGHGDGFGLCSGLGSGYGSGDGFGLGSIDGKEIFKIDDVQTIITQIKGSVAKGFILNSDLTMKPCFVAKGHGYFAHGESLREAVSDLQSKIFQNMDTEEAISEFIKKFKKGEKYKGTEFFDWHNYLTGSCKVGRESFVRNKGLNLDDMFTVDEFIEICENDYGSEVIKQLKERWSKNGKN